MTSQMVLCNKPSGASGYPLVSWTENTKTRVQVEKKKSPFKCDVRQQKTCRQTYMHIQFVGVMRKNKLSLDTTLQVKGQGSLLAVVDISVVFVSCAYITIQTSSAVLPTHCKLHRNTTDQQHLAGKQQL